MLPNPPLNMIGLIHSLLSSASRSPKDRANPQITGSPKEDKSVSSWDFFIK